MSESPVLAALAHPDREAVIPVDAAFVAANRANLDWLLDRLDKSTAGVRGLIASTPRMEALSLEEAEKTPQLSPTVVAIIAQAYAQYFLANKPRGNDQPGAFVGFDARFLSSD